MRQVLRQGGLRQELHRDQGTRRVHPVAGKREAKRHHRSARRAGSCHGNLGTVLNDPLLLRIGELLLYIWKQVFVIVILINTVQRYFFYFIEQNNSQENGSFRTVPSFLWKCESFQNCPLYSLLRFFRKKYIVI